MSYRPTALKAMLNHAILRKAKIRQLVVERNKLRKDVVNLNLEISELKRKS